MLTLLRLPVYTGLGARELAPMRSRFIRPLFLRILRGSAPRGQGQSAGRAVPLPSGLRHILNVPTTSMRLCRLGLTERVANLFP